VGSNYRLLTNLRMPAYAITDTYIPTQGTDAAVGLGEHGSAVSLVRPNQGTAKAADEPYNPCLQPDAVSCATVGL